MIETSSVNFNAEAVAAAWPADHGTCTALAIRKHILKIRKVIGMPSPRKARSGAQKVGDGVKKAPAKAKHNKHISEMKEQERAEADEPYSDTDDTDFGSVKMTDDYATDENNDLHGEEIISPSRTTKRGAAAAAAAAAKARQNVVVKAEPEEDAGIDASLNHEADENIAEI
ncbi:hypothetical protein MMC07_003226 [Pseudocyphellaria aurata]|nr:hypothetical protein [Pseudocyphellaria aurata]